MLTPIEDGELLVLLQRLAKLADARMGQPVEADEAQRHQEYRDDVEGEPRIGERGEVRERA